MTAAARLADAYLAAGRGTEALTCYQQVLDHYQRMPAGQAYGFTRGHPDITAARIGLGRALVMVGKPADATALLLEVARETVQFCEWTIPTR